MGRVVEKLCNRYQREMGYNTFIARPHFMGWMPTCDGCRVSSNKLIAMFNWLKPTPRPGLYDNLRRR